jgi:hypothetical protein
MKVYEVNGKQFQFADGEQPEGAVEVAPSQAAEPKGRTPQNKAKATANK